jgi:hypothetical protein
MSITDLTNKYLDYACRPSTDVTRILMQGSEKKKNRMQFADPYDHHFNGSRRFIDRKTFAPISRQDDSLMPPIKQGPLLRVSPLSNEDEDELITLFRETIRIEGENEAARA